MAIEAAALAIAACDLRLLPQLSEAFFEALDLRGGLLLGELCAKKEVTAVLEDVLGRLIALYAEDLVPIREQVMRERAELLLRKILAEVSTDVLVQWPFAHAGDAGGPS